MLEFIYATMLCFCLCLAVYNLSHVVVQSMPYCIEPEPFWSSSTPPHVFLSMPCCVQPEPCWGSSTPQCCGPVYAMLSVLYTLYAMLGFIYTTMLWSSLCHAVYNLSHAGVHLHHHVVFLSMPCCTVYTLRHAGVHLRRPVVVSSMPCCIQPQPCWSSSTPQCCALVYALLCTT
jgi:hypothetical protein